MMAPSHVPYTPSRLDRQDLTPRLRALATASRFTVDWAFAFAATRVRSVLHIANLWDTASDFAAALPTSATEGIPFNEASSFYNSCENEAARQAKGRCIIHTPMPELAPDKSVSLEPEKDSWSKQTVSRKKPKPLLTGSILAAGAASDSREAARIISLVGSLWELFSAIGPCGSLWDSYASLHGDLKADQKGLMLETWAELPVSSLTAALGVVTRWKSWAVQRKIPWRSPKASHVALWLRSLRVRGPTAAHGAFATMRWVEQHVGLKAHTSVAQVRAQGAVAPVHIERQAEPMPIRVWLYLEHCALSENAFVSAIALTWLFMLAGVIRYTHVQRSEITGLTSCMIKGIASRGKRRTQGKRRPFEWSVPRFSLKGLDLGARLQAYIGGASAGQPPPAFLLFDFLPARVGIRQVSSFAPRAMPMRRFIAFTRAMLSSGPLGLSKRECELITTYSARRVLPSVADAAGCSISERLAVGAWADPAPDGTLQMQARRLAMPVRYSEQRLVIAASIKSRLLKGVCSALSSFSALHPNARDPHWDDLLRLLPKGNSSQCHSDTIPKTKSLEVTHSDSVHYVESWICSRSKLGKLHIAKESVEETQSSSDQPSMYVKVLKPMCGKTLSDPISGSGPTPESRKWCYICRPPT